MPELYALGIYPFLKKFNAKVMDFLGGINQYCEIEINISRLKSDFKTGVFVPLCIHRITAYLVI